MNESPSANRKRDLAALIFAMVLPTIVTWVYFVALKEASPGIQQIAYSIGKTIQFAFPALFVWLYYRHRFKRRDKDPNEPEKSNDYWIGPAFGLFAVGLMFGLYFLILKDSEIAAGLMEKAGAKVKSMGLASVWVLPEQVCSTRSFTRSWKNITGVGSCLIFGKNSCPLARQPFCRRSDSCRIM